MCRPKLQRELHRLCSRGQRPVRLLQLQLFGIPDGGTFRPIHTFNKGPLRNFARNFRLRRRWLAHRLCDRAHQPV